MDPQKIKNCVMMALGKMREAPIINNGGRAIRPYNVFRIAHELYCSDIPVGEKPCFETFFRHTYKGPFTEEIRLILKKEGLEKIVHFSIDPLKLSEAVAEVTQLLSRKIRDTNPKNISLFLGQWVFTGLVRDLYSKMVNDGQGIASGRSFYTATSNHYRSIRVKSQPGWETKYHIQPDPFYSAGGASIATYRIINRPILKKAIDEACYKIRTDNRGKGLSVVKSNISITNVIEMVRSIYIKSLPENDKTPTRKTIERIINKYYQDLRLMDPSELIVEGMDTHSQNHQAQPNPKNFSIQLRKKSGPKPRIKMKTIIESFQKANDPKPTTVVTKAHEFYCQQLHKGEGRLVPESFNDFVYPQVMSLLDESRVKKKKRNIIKKSEPLLPFFEAALLWIQQYQDNIALRKYLSDRAIAELALQMYCENFEIKSNKPSLVPFLKAVSGSTDLDVVMFLRNNSFLREMRTKYFPEKYNYLSS